MFCNLTQCSKLSNNEMQRQFISHLFLDLDAVSDLCSLIVHFDFLIHWIYYLYAEGGRMRDVCKCPLNLQFIQLFAHLSLVFFCLFVIFYVKISVRGSIRVELVRIHVPQQFHHHLQQQQQAGCLSNNPVSRLHAHRNPMTGVNQTIVAL